MVRPCGTGGLAECGRRASKKLGRRSLAAPNKVPSCLTERLVTIFLVTSLSWAPMEEMQPYCVDRSATLDLYWIPLGAGAQVVRASGMAYERWSALMQHRSPQDLYHSALVAVVDGAATVIEMTPIPDSRGRTERGVVAEGPVGCRSAGHFRHFRYEIRRWSGGVIPDLASAVGSPVHLSSDRDLITQALALVPSVPVPVWGGDELRAGEMWNSNSVVAWLLTRIGLVQRAGQPPNQGRAPGWDAGVTVATRQMAESPAMSRVAP